MKVEKFFNLRVKDYVTQTSKENTKVEVAEVVHTFELPMEMDFGRGMIQGIVLFWESSGQSETIARSRLEGLSEVKYTAGAQKKIKNLSFNKEDNCAPSGVLGSIWTNPYG